MTDKKETSALEAAADPTIRVSEKNSDAIDTDILIARLRNAIQMGGGNKLVSARSGVPLGSLTNYLKGRQMPLSTAFRISQACGVPMDWLAGGGEIAEDKGNRSSLAVPLVARRITQAVNYNIAYVDYYNVAASAGYGLCADDGVNPEKVAISLHFLKQDLGLDPQHVIMLETSGDSMEPTLRSGDRLLVDTRRQHILDGVHVLVVNGGLLVKRLSSEPSGKICIASDNPLYKEFLTDSSRFRWGDPDGDDAITVIGRVAYRLQAMS
nr:XRE family transcriptional regulator [uncultured Acetobacter sp.]